MKMNPQPDLNEVLAELRELKLIVKELGQPAPKLQPPKVAALQLGILKENGEPNAAQIRAYYNDGTFKRDEAFKVGGRIKINSALIIARAARRNR